MSWLASTRGTKHSAPSGSRTTQPQSAPAPDTANIARILDELRLNWRIPNRAG